MAAQCVGGALRYKDIKSVADSETLFTQDVKMENVDDFWSSDTSLSALSSVAKGNMDMKVIHDEDCGYEEKFLSYDEDARLTDPTLKTRVS